MQIFVGETRDTAYKEELKKWNWGRMWTDGTPKLFDGEIWGFDNGAYGCFVRGRVFDDNLFKRRLDRAFDVGIPYLAVCPDIVAGGKKSLEFSLSWLPRLPRDWPWYIAVQDGMEMADVLSCLTMFDGLFLGGTNRFKYKASGWVATAREAGIPVHYGRCGTEKKINHARRLGVDSLDSSFPLWTRGRWRYFVDLITEGSPQQDLFDSSKPQKKGLTFR